MESLIKFDIVDRDSETFTYGNEWEIQEFDTFRRVGIAPASEHVTHMLNLAKNIEGPYMVLYVLIVPRVGSEEGRYQISHPLTFEKFSEIFESNKAFLENDGRHHIWISSTQSNKLIVYDHHNLLYLYNMDNIAINYLKNRGFINGVVNIPAPHIHNFHQKYDENEVKFLSEYDWLKFPLAETDSY